MSKWLLYLAAICAIFSVLPEGASGQQMKPKLNCTAVGNGNYVYGCSKVFWICSNGILYSQNCLSELFFDPVTNACERQEKIKLCTSQTQNMTAQHEPTRAKDPFTCTGKIDGPYEVGPCSPHFATCISETIHYQNCNSGLIWDDTKKYCEWPNQVASCLDKDRLNSRASEDDPNKAAAPGYGPQDTSIPTFAQQQHTSYGRQFINTAPSSQVESNSLPQQQQQQPVGPPGNPRSKLPLSKTVSYQREFDCTSKNDGLYPTPLNACASFFYKCAHGVTFKYNCPHKLYFSTQKVHCDFLDKVPECNGKVQAYPDGPLEWKTPEAPQEPFVITSNGISRQQPATDPQTKIAYNCQGKSNGFYQFGTCHNTYIRCLHQTAYPQQCPRNLVFHNEICEYLDECLKTSSQQPLPSRQQPQPQRPGSEHSHSVTEAQRYAVNVAQEHSHQRNAQRPPIQGQPQQQYPSQQQQQQNPHANVQPQQPQVQQQTNSQQVYQPTQLEKPQPDYKYSELPTQPPQQQSQQQNPPAIQDTFCQEKGLFHGYHSSGCNSYFFACYPHQTLRIPCPPGLFYEVETEACDYQANVVACGGTRPTQPPAQQPHAPKASQSYGNQQSVAPQTQQPPHQQQQSYGQQSVQVQQQPQQQPPLQQQQQTYGQQPLQQQQQLAPTPAPAWVPYPPQQQQIQQNPPAVPHSPQQTYGQQPAQQTENRKPQLPSQDHYNQIPVSQPTQQISQQPPIATSTQPRNSYPQQTVQQQNIQQSPPKQIETFCRDNSFEDGFHGAGCSPYFYVCALGETTRLHCPAGLFYEEESNECAPQSAIPACGGRKPIQIPVPQQSIPSSSSSLAQQQPATPEFDCNAKPNGAYSEGCTSKYFICNEQKSKTLYCPPGTYFSKTTELCDYKVHVVECGGNAPSIPLDAQHPILIPQKPYQRPQINIPQQQQPAASNYGNQYKSNGSPPVIPVPYGATPPQQQNPIQQQNPQPLVLATEAPPVDTKCQNFSNGIYGSQCNQLFFVCIERKVFDFKCPKDQAFNLLTVKCAPRSEIRGCPEFAQQQQPAPVRPQQSSYNHPQQSVAPSAHERPAQQQPPLQQQQQTYDQQPLQQLQPAPTPAPAWVPYPPQQQQQQIQQSPPAVPPQQISIPQPAAVIHQQYQQSQNNNGIVPQQPLIQNNPPVAQQSYV